MLKNQKKTLQLPNKHLQKKFSDDPLERFMHIKVANREVSQQKYRMCFLRNIYPLSVFILAIRGGEAH